MGRIVTPEEAQSLDRDPATGWGNSVDHLRLVDSWARLAGTVASEPDRIRAAVVRALRDFAEALTNDDAVPWDIYAHEHADAIENGADL